MNMLCQWQKSACAQMIILVSVLEKPLNDKISKGFEYRLSVNSIFLIDTVNMRMSGILTNAIVKVKIQQFC